MGFVDQEAINLYSGRYDKKGLNRLFPNVEKGCINFGYWETIPPIISTSERVESQLNLYMKIFSYSELNERNTKLLEVGCGRGHGVALLNQIGMNAYGIDPVDKQIKTSKSNYPLLKDRYLLGSSSQIPFNDNYFGRIISLEAAQHFPSFELFAKECFRVLSFQGLMTISTFFYRSQAAESKINDFLPANISGVHHAISIDLAKDLLKSAGFFQIQSFSIGEKVFAGYCQWANQLDIDTPHSSKWVNAYREGLIDYYILKGRK